MHKRFRKCDGAIGAVLCAVHRMLLLASAKDATVGEKTKLA
jgi:hypothetical protein